MKHNMETKCSGVILLYFLNFLKMIYVYITYIYGFISSICGEQNQVASGDGLFSTIEIVAEKVYNTAKVATISGQGRM